MTPSPPNIFICLSQYLKPLSEVDRHLEAHIAWIDSVERSGRMIAGGRQNPPVGGVHILSGRSKEEVRELLASDPFQREGVAAYWIFEFGLPPREGLGAVMTHYLDTIAPAEAP